MVTWRGGMGWEAVVAVQKGGRDVPHLFPLSCPVVGVCLREREREREEERESARARERERERDRDRENERERESGWV